MQPRHSKRHTANILQKFGLFFFKHKEITIVFWLAIVAFGLVSYTTLMKRQGFPNVDVPVSIVSGTYFVGDKNLVDERVSLPASNAIKNLPEVKSVQSRSADNFFILTIEYKDGTSSAEGNALVRTALNKNVLPPTASVEFKAIDAGRFEEQSDMLLSVYAPANNLSAEQLQQRADAVAKELTAIEGVQKAIVFKQIETGVNPQTGASVQEQRSFDRFGFRDLSGGIMLHRSVIVGVQAKPSTDILQLYDEVSVKIQSLTGDQNFKDVRVAVSADFAESIRAQVDGLQTSLLEGFAIVILVSLLLISWRAGIVTALSMATVLLATVGILYAVGITLNTITLFALILSLGLIVDDTTIVVEAIDAARGQKLDKYHIVKHAIGRVARASLTGTITTILAFAPMLFISGILGEFIRILPVSIIISLCMSLIISLSVVPFMAHFTLARQLRGPKLFNPFAWFEKKASSGLARLVRAGETSIFKRLLIGGAAFAISLALFFGSIPLFGKLKFDIFPQSKNSDEISVLMQYPEQTTLLQAEALADRADLIIGDTLGKYMRRLTYQNSGSTASSQITISLVSYKERTVTSPVLVSQLQTALAGLDGVRTKVSQVDAGPPKDEYPFAVRIVENDPAKAQRLALDIKSYLQGRSIERINGTKATIVRTEQSPAQFVTRTEGKRFIEIRAGFDADDVSALVNQTKQTVADRYTTDALRAYGITSDQLSYDFGNESGNQDSFKSMLLAFPILLAIMYILLLLQFRSFLQPLLIFMAIPFSFFGVAAGLNATNNALSFFVMVGFFALIGIALNNTILLTDFANQERDRGVSSYQAMALAIKARFRPLLVTSSMGIAGLIPLALTDPFWESLSVTLIFGLLSSTFLVIVTYPYIYLVGEWMRGIGARWWQRSLWRPLQIVLDILFMPIRVIRFLWWITFVWRERV